MGGIAYLSSLGDTSRSCDGCTVKSGTISKISTAGARPPAFFYTAYSLAGGIGLQACAFCRQECLVHYLRPSGFFGSDEQTAAGPCKIRMALRYKLVRERR